MNGKNIVKHIFDKALLCRTYREPYNPTTKKTNMAYSKNGQRTWTDFLQRRYTSAQQAHEKMLNIISYWGNTNQTIPIRMAII